ncbi:MAG: adenylate/guanylate cyclase domain-containing protein [Bacteroidales bacterium]|nr:adenylate/guanylate cyclase domain-containing protein [Bacteroidales bacterium]MBS3774050.1 adenylate/guanylate cyclase domain-containing protein [Bacteroidales bacterium]
MITWDKFVIRFNKMLHNLLSHFVFWYVSFLFFVFLTGEDQIFKIHLNVLQLKNLYLIILFLSAGVALLFTFLDGIFSDRILRFFPRRLMIFLKSMVYFVSAFILALLAARPSLDFPGEGNYGVILQQLPAMDIHFARFLVYFYLCGFFINFLKGVMRKVGKGNFRSWLLGMLNKPMEQERIFMFLDMKSSTSIAEKLNHKKFSHLIQDVFNDLEVVDNYQGEIYQYVGDGAIISWKLKDGLNNNNFLRAYYAFRRLIHRRRRYYRRKYGQEPRFKAGVHAGKVMVLQIGQIRRDISYNGDTINTAARIESKCNDYKQDILISKDLYDRLEMKNGFSFKHIGDVQLDGKRKAVGIYKVKNKK